MLHKRTMFEWVLIFGVLILAWMQMSQHAGWWPGTKTASKLGTAFTASAANSSNSPSSTSATTGTAGATSGGAEDAAPASPSGSGSSSTTGSQTPPSGSNGNANTGTGGTVSGSTGSGGTVSSNVTSPLINVAAKINTGMTKDALLATAQGFTEHCTIVVNTSLLGKQEVCILSQANQIITVTLLNDRVLSASL